MLRRVNHKVIPTLYLPAQLSVLNLNPALLEPTIY